MPRPTKGHRVPGSGRKKGSTAPHTQEKLVLRELLRQKVAAHFGPLLDAQIANAQGIQHFVLRDKAGKFVRVTSAEAAVQALNNPESVYEFWTRDPSIQAAAYLIDQAIDKAAQPQKIGGEDGGPVEHVFRWQR